MTMPMASPWHITACSFDALSGWEDDDHHEALAAFKRSAAHHLKSPYKQRQIAFDPAAFNAACRASLENTTNAKAFFEFWFQPYFIQVHTGPTKNTGKITGYYEPIIEARLTPSGGFDTAFLRRPADLVELNDADAAHHSGMRFGRIARKGSLERFEAYFTRADIDGGDLAHRQLEIAYVEDPVDAFFAHVQGCARLRLAGAKTDQQTIQEVRITYDGKSGHEFTGIGSVLIAMGEIPAANISMQSIRDWLKANPSRVQDILHRNQSYIFFREEPVFDEALGPVAAAKVPVTQGRSIAVDRTIHAFGLPFFITALSFTALQPHGFARLMIAQDTGSAILGAARADVFVGSGDAAGAIAGSINHPANFHILLPREGAM